MSRKIIKLLIFSIVLLFLNQCSKPSRQEKFVLRNGLRVVFLEKDSPITSAVFCVPSGIGDGSHGIMQVTSQMLYQGTEVRTTHQFFDELASLGGTIGSRTTLNMSYIYTQSPEMTFEKCFELLCECVSAPSFDNEILSRIHVGRELKVDGFFTGTHHYYDSHIRQMLFGQSTLSRQFYSKKHAFSREMILDYYRKRFVPDNIVLVLSGRFNSRKILIRAASMWQNLIKDDITKKESPIPGNDADSSEKSYLTRDDYDKVWIGFRAPSFLDDFYFETRLLEKIVVSDRNNLILKNMPESRSRIKSISSYYHSENNCGYFIVSAKTNPGEGKDIKREILRILEELKRSDIPEDSFNIAKRKLLSETGIAQQYTLYNASLLGAIELSHEPDMTLTDFEKHLRTISLQSIQEAAENLFRNPVVWFSQSSQ